MQLEPIPFIPLLQPWLCDNLIRLGKAHDGGYLVNYPDILATDLLLSLGIDTDWSFEQDFLSLTRSCILHAYDDSLKDLKLNNLLAPYHEFFKTPFRRHFPIRITEESFLTALESTGSLHTLFLKCDIEASEYAILDTIIRNRTRFSGMVIEFHNVSEAANYHRMLDFITRCGLSLVHVHINNYAYIQTQDHYIPNVLELSFSASDNCVLDRTLTLPHNLDQLNNPEGLAFYPVFDFEGK